MKRKVLLSYALIIPIVIVLGRNFSTNNALKQTSESTNLVVNGDFEIVTNNVFPNWKYDATGLVADRAPNAITKTSIRFTGTTLERYLSSDAIIVKPGSTYKFQFTCRIQGKAGPNPGIETINGGEFRATIADGVGNKKTPFKAITTTSPTNITLSGLYTVPAGQTSIKLVFYKNADVAYLDDVSLVEVTASN
ncbi:hypothetical protein N9R54_05030 [Pelobium sp.]|nr:carbohydrate binding domain-containing protein [Pelobium sp.]MDA9555581.1 hypothetical protein [Pelobium sp.]